MELQNLDRVPVLSWNDTQIVVTVPPGTTPGNAYISQNGTWSNGIPFSMIPANIASISPAMLAPGVQVTLSGSGFGAVQGSGFVELQNVDRVPVLSWSDTQIRITVPAGTIPGNAHISQNGTWSNGIPFSMIPANIVSISPTMLAPGMQVTLTGSGFGASPGSGFVELQNVDRVPVISWSDTKIVVTVPAGTIPGNAHINQNGVWSNGIPFSMIPANIASISPTTLTPGTQATLTGSGFGASPGSGFVELQNLDRVPVISWSDTRIVVTVPAGTVSGRAFVNQDGTWSNGVPFTIDNATSGALSASPLNFGNVQVGSSSTQPVTLTNTAQSTVNILQAIVAGPGFSLSVFTAPVSLEPGQRFTLNVTFAPNAAGALSGTLVILSDATNPSLTVPLSGTGLAGGTLTVAPAISDLGSVVVGASKILPAILGATGRSVVVSGVTSSSAEFTVTGVSFPLTVPAGQSVPFSLDFTPQATGAVSANIVFASDASNSPTTEAVTGIGVAQPEHQANLSWSPSPSEVAGYNVYRGTQPGGPYALTNSALEATTSFSDPSVQPGNTYYYVVTAVDSSGAESTFSNEVQAVIPSP